MIKVITIAIFLLVFAGCSTDYPDGEADMQTPVPSFRIESEQPDPSARAITVNIRFLGPATESQVKSAAQFVIADRKERYQAITVNSFVSSASATAKPFGISSFEGGEITHRFNRQSESMRIPTH